MATHSHPLKGKSVLVIAGSAPIAHWLIDQEARITLADHSLIRSAQAHVRTIVSDGQEYERRKKNVQWIDDEGLAQAVADADIVVAPPNHAVQGHACEYGIPVVSAQEVRRLKILPASREVVRESKKITIIRDPAATSPTRAAAAVERFGGPNCILVAGGRGRGNYAVWAESVTRRIRPTNLVFLSGSATRAMRVALGPWGRGIRAYDSMERCEKVARDRAKLFVQATILFSLGAEQ